MDDCITKFTLAGDGFTNIPAPVGSEVEVRLVRIFEVPETKISREMVYEMFRAG